MNPEYVSSLANHLWQSTLFAGLAGLLTLTLRNNHARVRHGVWLAASCKFLIPLSVLVAMGGHIRWQSAPDTMQSNWSVVIVEVGRPFTPPAGSSPLLATAPPAASRFPAILLGIWACGFLGIACSWWIRWRRIRRVVSAGAPAPMEIEIRAICTRTSLEPGVFGIFRPVLLLPEGICERLTPAQLQAVVAHELSHVRHWDNLIAAMHMFVETVFWFHPLVWWIGKWMVEERERACDEEVLRLGSEPRVYAEGILNVCKSYLSSPLACASGVSGSDLKRRIEVIVTNRAARKLDIRRRVLLIGAGLVALTGPIAVGIFGTLPIRGQAGAESGMPAFEAASVKRHPDTEGRRNRTRTIEPGSITCLDISLGELIVMAYGVKPYQISGPRWIMDRSGSDVYDVIATAGNPAPVAQVKHMLGPLLADRFHLVFHRETRELPVFVLLVAKGGPKFKEPGDGGEPSVRPDDAGGLSFQNFSMDDLAVWLAMHSLRRPVIDHTSLAGSFSFHANLFEMEKGAPPSEFKTRVASDDASGALRTALTGQLGLKLEAQKAPLEILVIDHAEKVPTEN